MKTLRTVHATTCRTFSITVTKASSTTLLVANLCAVKNSVNFTNVNEPSVFIIFDSSFYVFNSREGENKDCIYIGYVLSQEHQCYYQNMYLPWFLGHCYTEEMQSYFSHATQVQVQLTDICFCKRSKLLHYKYSFPPSKLRPKILHL